MILRLFRARPRPGQETAYMTFLTTQTLPFLKRQKGLRSVQIAQGHPTSGTAREVLILTVWESEAALRAAAGAKWEQGVIDEKAEAPLLQDSSCAHYETVAP